MNKSLAIVLFLGLSACTSPSPSPAPNPLPPALCKAETDFTTFASAELASGANCTHPDVIQADLMAALATIKINFCPDPATMKNRKGPIGDVMCPLVINTLAPIVTSKVLRPTWGCDPSAKLADPLATLAAACSKAVGY